jgi:hypothetical protein
LLDTSEKLRIGKMEVGAYLGILHTTMLPFTTQSASRGFRKTDSLFI